MTADEALANLEAMTKEAGAPTLYINRQMLRQYLEPIRATLTELRAVKLQVHELASSELTQNALQTVATIERITR